MRGPSAILKRLADRMLGTKGVLSGSVTGLSVIPTRGAEEKHAHGHGHVHDE